MGLIIKGIRKISQLEIDADKDWNVKGVTNLKELVTGMQIGDIAVRGTNTLEIVAAGPNGNVLTSAGPGHKPVWAPAGGSLIYYFPVPISSAHSETIITPDQVISKNALLETSHAQSDIDDPADLIRRFDVDLDSAIAVAVVVPDQNISKNARLKAGVYILVDGFVEETSAAVQTDKTAEARDATANDLNLNPMDDAVGAKVYVGSNYPFWAIAMQEGTQGVGNWTNVWNYWNGAWTAVVDENDGSNEWQTAPGLKIITHTPQGDWVPTIIQGMNLYWLMSDTTNWVNRITKPLGTQVWVAINV